MDYSKDKSGQTGRTQTTQSTINKDKLVKDKGAAGTGKKPAANPNQSNPMSDRTQHTSGQAANRNKFISGEKGKEGLGSGKSVNTPGNRPKQ